MAAVAQGVPHGLRTRGGQGQVQERPQTVLRAEQALHHRPAQPRHRRRHGQGALDQGPRRRRALEHGRDTRYTHTHTHTTVTHFDHLNGYMSKSPKLKSPGPKSPRSKSPTSKSPKARIKETHRKQLANLIEAESSCSIKNKG